MEILDSLAQDLIRSNCVAAFSGAGISSESGIPTYRGAGGLWTKYDPNLYANINHFNRVSFPEMSVACEDNIKIFPEILNSLSKYSMSCITINSLCETRTFIAVKRYYFRNFKFF